MVLGPQRVILRARANEDLLNQLPQALGNILPQATTTVFLTPSPSPTLFSVSPGETDPASPTSSSSSSSPGEKFQNTTSPSRSHSPLNTTGYIICFVLITLLGSIGLIVIYRCLRNRGKALAGNASHSRTLSFRDFLQRHRPTRRGGRRRHSLGPEDIDPVPPYVARRKSVAENYVGETHRVSDPVASLDSLPEYETRQGFSPTMTHGRSGLSSSASPSPPPPPPHSHPHPTSPSIPSNDDTSVSSSSPISVHPLPSPPEPARVTQR